MKRIAVITIALLASLSNSWAQCAMCRSTLENNYSNGNPGIAAGINTGILYLLVLPYSAVMILGYLWYKSSKDARNKLSGSTAAG
ncbi:hypothetical protein [Ohtaekwangia sp.]|uniref:hypothetical protein n=1 Tax=Ohtaekwangia sp. TaxID=2066019 RepID=UPI002F925439